MAPTSKLAAGSSDRRHRPPSKESPDPDDLPSSVIWVGNLHPEITEPDLLTTFSKFSALDATIAYSSTRNYAFIFFKSPEDAKSAKESLSGSSLRGKKMLLDFARPARPAKRLWVGGIAPAATGKLLEQKFSKFGKIVDFEFHSNRNTAFLEFGKFEEAIAAKKEMDRKRVLGQEIHVDFQRQGQGQGQSSRPSNRAPPPQVESIHRGIRDGPHSNTLWVGYPPSVPMDEQMLHNAMILFGEIERIKSFPSRHYCFVEFRSVDEARRAKEGLQGRLFGDPRIQIMFSCSDLGRSKDNAPLLPGFPVPRLDMIFVPPNGIPGSNLLIRPYMPQGFDPDWGRTSPGPGMIPSLLGARQNLQPVWDDGFDTRESKRSRFYSSPTDGEPFHGRRVDDESFCRSPDVDYYWRGIIAKGGSHVCHARCVPIGKGLESPMPDVVNCSARTDLDVLTKHYAEAIGSDIVFFVPDSEDDFGPYTEFLRYLGSKSRAGVAKFDDGTTMFLVPPSDFLTQVLNVSGPERLYGVVLKLPQQQVALMPQRPQAVLPLPPQYEDGRGRSISQEHYDYIPQSEDSALRMDYGSTMHDSVSRGGVGEQHIDGPHSMPSASHGYSRNQETASQAEVSLTPELIATLASLIPSGNQSSSITARSSSYPTASSNDAAMGPQGWCQDYQATYSGAQLEMADNTHQHSQHFGQQQQQVPQFERPQQPLQQFGQQQQPLQQFGQQQQQFQQFGHQYTNQPPFGSQYPPYASLPTGADNSTQSFLGNGQGQEFGSNMQRAAYDSYGTHGTLHAQDTGVMFNQSTPYQSAPNLSAEGQDGRVLQPQTGLPSSGDNAEYSQMQQLQTLLNNSGEGPSQGNDDKNQRYQSTLQFAASLLQKIQQQQQSSSHAVDGSGN